MPEALEVIPDERAELERLERIIRTGIVSFLNVAEALIQIRDKQYYRKVLGFETFGEYCETKWGMTRQRAYQLIDAKQVADNLSTTVGKGSSFGLPDLSNNLTKEEIEGIPATQLSALKDVPPEDQPTVYKLAKETAPEGKLTAAHVERTVREVTETKKRTVAPRTYTPGSLLKDTTDAMLLASAAIECLDKIKATDRSCKEALAKVAVYIWNRQHGIEA